MAEVNPDEHEPDVHALKAIGGATEVPPECQADFLEHFNNRYHAPEVAFSDHGAAYEYGYRMGSENRACQFEAIEEILQTDYLTAHPNTNWEKMRAAVKFGWECALTRRRNEQ